MSRSLAAVTVVSFLAITCTLVAQRPAHRGDGASARRAPPAVAVAAAPGEHGADSEEEDESRLEVEVVGKLHDAATATKYIILAMASPCELKHLDDAKPVGIDALEPSAERDKLFGFEAVVDADERPYLCAIAFDAKRRIIGFGQPSAKASPLAVAREPGEEYGRAHGVDVTIHAVEPLALNNDFIMDRVH